METQRGVNKQGSSIRETIRETGGSWEELEREKQGKTPHDFLGEALQWQHHALGMIFRRKGGAGQR